MTNETERHMIQIQEAGDVPMINFNPAWVDEQFPNADIDVGLSAIVGECPDIKTEEELARIKAVEDGAGFLDGIGLENPCDVVNPDYPCMPKHPPYTPPALEMDRLYKIQRNLINGRFGLEAMVNFGDAVMPNDVLALVNEILRLRGEAVPRIGGTD